MDFHEIQRFVIRLLVNFCHDHNLAEEAFQEAYLRYHRKFPSGQIPANEAQSWLFTVGRRWLKDRWRTEKRRRALIEFAFQAIDVLNSPQDLSDIEKLKTCLQTLPPNERELLELRYDQGLPVKDIAEVLSEPANTISKRITRALQRLRTCFDSHGPATESDRPGKPSDD